MIHKEIKCRSIRMMNFIGLVVHLVDSRVQLRRLRVMARAAVTRNVTSPSSCCSAELSLRSPVVAAGIAQRGPHSIAPRAAKNTTTDSRSSGRHGMAVRSCGPCAG